MSVLSLRHAFRLITKSANKKTGGIPQSYTAPVSCPNECPLKDSKVCYATFGHVRLHWDASTSEKFGLSADEFCAQVQSIPAGTLFRHNVAGDICIAETSDIDTPLLRRLTHAFRNLRAYTYTHARLTLDNIKATIAATAHGFTVNHSCETLEEVDWVIRNGGLAVVTVTDAPLEKWITPEGNTVRLCRNFVDGTTCKDCQWCAKSNRSFAVAFKAHGTKAKQFERVIMLKQGKVE